MEEKALGPSPLRLATSPPQADHVLVDLFSSVADGGLCGKAPPHLETVLVVRTGNRGGEACYEHLVSRRQGCC